MAKNKTKTSSKPALGRGLGNLISKGASGASEGSGGAAVAVAKPVVFEEIVENSPYRDIPVDKIDPSPYQARMNLEHAEIEALAGSIKAEGLLQPIVVRKKGSRYELIAGERRWRSFQFLKEKTIPARIIDATDSRAAVVSMIENLQRENLNPVDEAMGYASLMRDFDLTQEQVSEKVSKPRATIANSLRLVKLEQEIQGYLAKGMISTGHAKVILSLENPSQRMMLARRIIEGGLSVRDTEELAKTMRNSTVSGDIGGGRPVAAVQSAVIRDLEKQIATHLTAKVSLKHNANKKGKIVINYSSNDDLHRILDKIGFARPKIGSGG